LAQESSDIFESNCDSVSISFSKKSLWKYDYYLALWSFVFAMGAIAQTPIPRSTGEESSPMATVRMKWELHPNCSTPAC
jgi:hypothetical protein